MREGWTTAKLGVLTTKIGSGATPLGGEAAYKASGITLIRSLNVHDDGFRAEGLAHIDQDQADRLANVVVEPGDVLLNITGASIARCCLVPSHVLPARVNQHVSIIRPIKGRLDSGFLRYLLISRAYKDRLLSSGETGGSTRQALTQSQLRELRVEYPQSLTEQRRIVAMLDEAFADIAIAKANAESNLRNARAVFESYVEGVFAQRGEGWVKKRLVEVCVLQRGFDLPTQSRVIGEFPIVSSSGVIAAHNEARAEGPGVATGRSGSIGNVFYIGSDYWPLNTVLYVKDFHGNDPKFVYRLLRHFDLGRFASGAGVPTLNRNFVHDEAVFLPESVAVQRRIAEKIETVERETEGLGRVYRQRLALLGELKKSLLDHAFTGQLTSRAA